MYELLAEPHYLSVLYTNRNAAAFTGTASKIHAVVDDPSALSTDILFAGPATYVDHLAGPYEVPYDYGRTGYQYTPGFDFFEKMHVIPRTLHLGNILSAQAIPMELFNGFRRLAQSWTSFVNNAGIGTDLVGTGPVQFIAPLDSILRVLEIGTAGPAIVDTTLDFGFTVYTLEIPISFQRVVLFAVVPPETPYEEVLEFKTDILEKVNDTEQRISVRKRPRQEFVLEFRVEDGRERVKVENFLFRKLGSSFGLPIWHEATPLTAPAIATDTVIAVGDTDFADFRVGGFAVIYVDGDLFDVLSVASFTTTSITFSNPLTNSYPRGTSVIPLRIARTEPKADGARWPVNLSRVQLTFTVEDNEIDIADASAYGTYAGRVLFDDYNFVRGTSDEGWDMKVAVFDSESGQVFQQALSDRMRHRAEKMFLVDGRENIWRLRQLMHYLRGKQKSFWLPTFRDELVPVLPLVLSSNTLDIENVGYAQFVDSLQPRNVIRLTLVDGTVHIREILSSLEVDATRETLTLDDVWPAAIAIDDVERIEFVEKMRFDTDRIRIRYEPGKGVAVLQAPVRAVRD
jgi:hypothetical protein